MSNPVQEGGQPLYECVEYGDGATVWGPVRQASLTLGNEPSVQLPVHVTGSTDGNPGTVCAGSPLLTSPGPNPNQARYNGTLGVGFRVQDCRSGCANIVQNGFYYTCNGGACTGSLAPLTSQVQNPVAKLPSDNNGVIVMLPSVPSTGAPANSVSGYLVLGIGTPGRSNNTPSGVTPYGANSSGFITTTFNGSSFPQSFLDTGSNGLFFPNFGISTSGDFYAPPSTLSLSAVNTGASNAPNQGLVNFEIANINTLAGSGNIVFSNIGAPVNSRFDWGLPFFLGRNVYVGIEGRTSQGLAVGPFWAY